MAITINNKFVTPVAATDTVLYTCASVAGGMANFTICNTSVTETTFSLFIKRLGADPFYLFKDEPIIGKANYSRVAGDTLLNTDEVWVHATDATLDFSAAILERPVSRRETQVRWLRVSLICEPATESTVWQR